MKKILVIVNFGPAFDETSLNKAGVGGSETWAIQLAESFSRKGNDVSILCNCKTHYTYAGNNFVKYVSLNDADSCLRFNKFDLVIISRQYSNLIQIIDDLNASSNVYIQAHDTEIFGDDFKLISQCKNFRGVSTLSAYQEKSIHDKHNVDWKYFVRIGNGIDPALFQNRSFTPTNKRLLHSSAFYRGGEIVKKYIAPYYTQFITDGGVDFCSYADQPPQEKNKVLNRVEVLGSLSKPQLYDQMQNRYCWFYPLTADETFCITMIENIMCENDIIVPFYYGPTSVLEPFVNDITMKHNFRSDGGKEFNLAIIKAGERIIESINNHEKGEELRKELKNYVLQNYTWDIIADKWLKLI